MKRIFYLFLNVLYLTSFAQGAKQANTVVEYKIFNNTDIPNTLSATLFVNGQVTIYLPKYSTMILNDANQEAKQKKRVIPDMRYLKIDHKKKEILSFENLAFYMVLVKDDYNEMEWKITEEAKAIGGYNCTKATTNYRGMEWTAWFTTEIPMPYGPWKLQGLPGLIMEAHNGSNEYTFTVEKIEYRKDAIFDKDFNTLVETKNNAPMPKREYIEKQDEFESNQDAQMMQSTPGIVEIKKVSRGGYELKYEWEP